MIPHEAACQLIFIFKSELSQFPVCFFSILLKIFWQSFSKLSLGKTAWKPAKKQKASYTSGLGFGCSRNRLLFWGWCSKAQMFGCRNAALLATPVFSCEQWVVAPKSWRSPQRLEIHKSEAWKAAATRATLNPPLEVRYQFWVSPLPFLPPSPGWKPGWLCIARGRGIWLVVSEYCSQHQDGCSLPSAASTSGVTGPALPQVAKPEPLFIILLYSEK